MPLKNYFEKLIERIESSDEITNAGKDSNGFYKPTRTILLRNLTLLRDLHDKPRAQEMVKAAWAAVVEEIPPDWLKLQPDEKTELLKIMN